MAGRVPAGAQLSEVGVEMETTFVQNLKHAADILSKVKQALNPSSLLLPRFSVLLENWPCLCWRRHIFFCGMW